LSHALFWGQIAIWVHTERSFCILPFCFCLSTQFHPALEGSFDALRRLDFLKVGDFEVRFDLVAAEVVMAGLAAQDDLRKTVSR
jgi:hypothetical protein